MPTMKEIAAAATGPPATPRNCEFTPNCIETAVPAASATGTNKNHVMRVNPRS